MKPHLRLVAIFILVATVTKAQPITKEPFYKDVIPFQEKIVGKYLQQIKPRIKLKDFKFAYEEEFSYSDTLKNYIDTSTTILENKVPEHLPYSLDSNKYINFDAFIDFDSAKKQYTFGGGDHGQYIYLTDTSNTYLLWHIGGWFPNVDYGIWFGNDAFALLVWQSDYDATKPTKTLELRYYDLKTFKKRVYTFSKKIKGRKNDFWTFYFKEYYKNKKSVPNKVGDG